MGQGILDEFCFRHLPRMVTEEKESFFPTPSGATWGELRIRFVDGHTISVSLRGIARLYQYSDLGMVDSRSKKPTRQWDLLREFASLSGVLRRDSAKVDGRDQKRRERLARELRAFFRIEGEPIVVSEDGRTAQTEFQLEADG